jgi:uncharacterized membrane protein HdeD (DUF308 family)
MAATRSARSARSGRKADVEMLAALAKYWWLVLGTGIAWTLVSVVILQFDQASINTVGIIIGFMFAGAAIQNLAIASLSRGGMRWVFAIFGVIFVGASVISFISPENTFAAIADILGFLFLVVGVFWIIEAFAGKDANELWWLGLVTGILMVILAFYTGGQFFIEKAYVLLVFAGIWALMQGIKDITLAFQLRKLG